LKNALWLKETHPGARILVLHRDLRAVGFDELWYERARAAGVVAVRVPDDDRPLVEPRAEGDGAVVRFYDSLIGRKVRVDADLVVLSTGLEPHLSPEDAEKLGLTLDAQGFVTEANVKYRPVEADRRGHLVAGAAVAPVLVPEAMAQGEAAAARIIARLTRDRVAPRPGAVAYRAKWCAHCGLCIDVCPAGARELDVERGAIVHAGLCQGCGACAAACPSGCTEQPDLDIKGVFDAIEAAWEVVP
jgi:heterodisulfide reductase subunit A